MIFAPTLKNIGTNVSRLITYNDVGKKRKQRVNKRKTMDKKKIAKEILSQSYNVTDQAGNELSVIDTKDVFDIINRLDVSDSLPCVSIDDVKICECSVGNPQTVLICTECEGRYK